MKVFAKDLENLIKQLVLTKFIKWLLILLYLKNLVIKSRKKTFTKTVYLN